MATYRKLILSLILTSLLGTSFFSFWGTIFETNSIPQSVDVLLRSLIITVIISCFFLLIVIPVIISIVGRSSGKKSRDEHEVFFAKQLSSIVIAYHVLIYPISSIINKYFLPYEENVRAINIPILIPFAILLCVISINLNLFFISQTIHYRGKIKGKQYKPNTTHEWLTKIASTSAVFLWYVATASSTLFIDSQATEMDYHRYILLTGICIWMSIFLCSAPAYIITFNIRKQTRNITKWIQNRKVDHNFSEKLSVAFTEDMIQMENSINMFMNNLYDTLSFLADNSIIIIHEKENIMNNANRSIALLDEIINSLTQIQESASSQKELIDITGMETNSLVTGASEIIQEVSFQNQSIQQSSASISEISAAISSIADMARQANIISTVMKEGSESGRTALTQATEMIRAIQHASLDIQAILQSIQKIAKQTNLLSMNASIEAAHAGDTGRGFAIVADEVRSLSSLSNRNAKEIEAHIEEMIEKVNHGVEAINAAVTAFNDINDGIGENFDLINQISESMNEQQKATQSTLEATFKIVKSVEHIYDFADRQSEYTNNTKAMMNEVISLAERINSDIELQNTELQEITTAAKNAVAHIETDRVMAKRMLETIQSFQNIEQQEIV